MMKLSVKYIAKYGGLTKVLRARKTLEISFVSKNSNISSTIEYPTMKIEFLIVLIILWQSILKTGIYCLPVLHTICIILIINSHQVTIIC